MPLQTSYTNILVPVDFSESSIKTIERGLGLQKKFGAKLTVVSFINPINNMANLYSPTFVDIEEKLFEDAKDRMIELCKPLNIAAENTIVEIGHPKKGILNIAKREKIDLIVIGSHGHHGLIDTMLGSTVNAITGHASCDVLIVRAKK